MPHKNNLPLRQGMIRRPRLHALISEGLGYPLLVFQAGSGFGKTQAMADFLSQNNEDRILWMRLGSLDNLHTRFWDHLTCALGREFPGLAARMENLEFPGTLYKYDEFLQALTSEISGGRRVLWTFDDFGEITDKGVKDFFRMLAEPELENFRLVLLSNSTSNMNVSPLMAGSVFHITGGDLRFTPMETAELYRMHGLSPEDDELIRVEQYTEGWPLALNLLALQGGGLLDESGGGSPVFEGVSRLFAERFFNTYPPDLQKFFAALSLLPSFTRDLMVNLYDGDPADLEVVGSHMFITSEPAVGCFKFHNLYRVFLQEKKHLLSPEEENLVWRKAGEYYAASRGIGDVIEAIACYRKCGDHKGMLQVISDIAKWQYEITAENAAYFLEHLDVLTAEEVRQYPVADYLRALINVCILELEKAEALLTDLEQRLLAAGTPEAFTLLGDVYAALGAIHMMRCEEDFGDYYKKAVTYLPEGTNFTSKNKLLTHNNNYFAMPDNLPEAKERMEQAMHYGVSWISRFLSGGMSGLEHIFSAEAAYLSYDLDSAEQHAYRGIYKAEANDQHGLVCNGFFILARISFMRGNLADTARHIQSIADYAGRFSIPLLKEIRDTAQAWYYIRLHDFGRIPRSILNIHNSEQPLLDYGRPQLIYALYMITIGEYARLLGMLEYPKGLYMTWGIWPDRISLNIMTGIIQYHLGNTAAAMEALWSAYDMSCHNGLITMFIEGENHIAPLIAAARQQNKYPFDPQWLDLIEKQSADFARRAAVVRASYKKQSAAKPAKENPLTRREEEILLDLSRGLTREEIAEAYAMSLNTIKSFIKTIYHKLNVSNQAEAVSIAMLNGYIEIPPQE
ncbi:LuxR C-terminal-related transcriptional regulator [Breznakiella homolactica]|uniref:HTH luxR-type domain-containing protein n=1 Tax=Breznakiella homolactica TaxID=2798577 RepID=A0A7T8B9C5_9SPIR|nr:LuxR C-terminal-related transcriptional regulator [Breznakiella homolactica]QQO07820.1 LuxR C-terminal-related transcriptional regulator [Breznakiella homolactica]